MATTAPGSGGGLTAGATAFVQEVESFIGVPYVWGGSSPSGFDCSGLVYYVAQQLGIKGMPRTSEEQWAWVKSQGTTFTDPSQLQPGDLIFYTFPYETPPGHVTVYVGNNQLVQAASPGTDVEKVPVYGNVYGYAHIPGITSASLGTALQNQTGNQNQPGPGPSGGGLGSWASNVFDDIFKASSPLFDLSGISGVSDVAQALTGLSAPFIKIGEAVDWFWNPTHWVRIGCLIGGSFFTIAGIVTMSRTGRSYAVSNPVAGASAGGFSLPSQIPAPGGQLAPALGIAEVTVGAILLFFAFHNVPSSVTGIPSFFGYLTSVVHGAKAGIN